MKKKIFTITSFILISALLCACGDTKDYSAWMPKDGYKPVSHNDQDTEGNSFITTAAGSFSANDLTKAFLDEDDSLADKLWQTQITNEIYSVTQKELKRNSMVYYVSSSEGDDENLGLSPETPKRTLTGFSGVSNVTILLKCGDTFEMDQSFTAGNKCVYATYGSGPRPVLDYYKPLDVKFTEEAEYAHVWKADLSKIFKVRHSSDDEEQSVRFSDCNIGQLLIDGKVNWNRLLLNIIGNEAPDYAKYLEEDACESWAVDWMSSTLYLYSKTDPNKKNIKYADFTNAVFMSGIKNTVLKGWEIKGAGTSGCTIENCTEVTLASCYFHDIGGTLAGSPTSRTGNAIQVVGQAKDVMVEYNFVSWIFNGCFVDQVVSTSEEDSNLTVRNNIGTRSYVGIDTIGDALAEKGHVNIVYSGNILSNMCDITDPDEKLYADKLGGLLRNNVPEPVEEPVKDTKKPKDSKDPKNPEDLSVSGTEENGTGDKPDVYLSYRGSGNYTGISCICNYSSKNPEGLVMNNNVCWNTSRLLILYTKSGPKAYFNDNLLYSEDAPGDACMYLVVDKDMNIDYSNKNPFPGNKNYLGYDTSGNDIEPNDAVDILKSTIGGISGYDK